MIRVRYQVCALLWFCFVGSSFVRADDFMPCGDKDDLFRRPDEFRIETPSKNPYEWAFNQGVYYGVTHRQAIRRALCGIFITCCDAVVINAADAHFISHNLEIGVGFGWDAVSNRNRGIYEGRGPDKIHIDAKKDVPSTLLWAVPSRAGCKLKIRLEYASNMPIDMKVYVDGELIRSVKNPTGGWCPSDRKWIDIGSIDVGIDGITSIKAVSAGFFPHVSKLLLEPAEN